MDHGLRGAFALIPAEEVPKRALAAACWVKDCVMGLHFLKKSVMSIHAQVDVTVYVFYLCIRVVLIICKRKEAAPFTKFHLQEFAASVQG